MDRQKGKEQKKKKESKNVQIPLLYKMFETNREEC